MRAASSLLLLAAVAACADRAIEAPVGPTTAALRDAAGAPGVVGAVFTETNDAFDNAVVAFAREADGSLVSLGAFSTGGEGVGGTVDALASQFALVLTPDHRFLYAVNAGSSSITAFAVARAGLTRIGTVSSGGTRPVSLAATNGLLYALNAGSNTVAGFRIQSDGSLAPVSGWTRALGADASGAAAIRFSHDGALVAVTERTSQSIDTYVVHPDGSLGTAATTHSNGSTPFGFDFTPRGQLVVSEAGSGAVSSYDAARDGMLSLVSGSAKTYQTAPCWLIVTNDGRFAYTANAGSGSVSGFSVAANGSLSLLSAGGRTGDLGAGSSPLDLDLSRDSRFLYVLEVGTGTIGAFAVNGDGTLVKLGDAGNLTPRAGQMGLAAY